MRPVNIILIDVGSGGTCERQSTRTPGVHTRGDNLSAYPQGVHKNSSMQLSFEAPDSPLRLGDTRRPSALFRLLRPAEAAEHLLLVGFDAGLIEGIHTEKISRNRDGMLEKINGFADRGR